MPPPTFLTLEHVQSIHRHMVDVFGGAGGVRDRGLLESAIMLPAAQFEGRFLHDGIPAMAAAYLFHVCRNHPFLDGNKRTALAASEIFLVLNGHLLQATDEALETLTVGIADGTLSKEDAVIFYNAHAKIG